MTKSADRPLGIMSRSRHDEPSARRGEAPVVPFGRDDRPPFNVVPHGATITTSAVAVEMASPFIIWV